MKVVLRTETLGLALAEGPLYRVWGEDGPYHFFDIQLGVTLKDGRQFVHSRFVSKGGFNCRNRAEAFRDKVQAAGVIDLTHWTEVQPGPSMEERFAPFGSEWQHEQEQKLWEGC